MGEARHSPERPAGSAHRLDLHLRTICPKQGKGAALILPAGNTEAMNLHLAEIAKTGSWRKKPLRFLGLLQQYLPIAAIASGSRLTFESRRGFPSDWMQLRTAAESGESIASISKRMCRSEGALPHRARALGIVLRRVKKRTRPRSWFRG